MRPTPARSTSTRPWATERGRIAMPQGPRKSSSPRDPDRRAGLNREVCALSGRPAERPSSSDFASAPSNCAEALVVAEPVARLLNEWTSITAWRPANPARLDERRDGPVHKLVTSLGYVVGREPKVRAEESEPLPLAFARGMSGSPSTDEGIGASHSRTIGSERLGHLPLDGDRREPVAGAGEHERGRSVRRGARRAGRRGVPECRGASPGRGAPRTASRRTPPAPKPGSRPPPPSSSRALPPNNQCATASQARRGSAATLQHQTTESGS